MDAGKPVVVTFGFELIQIVEVFEEHQSIEMKLWLRMEWINEFLRWNPENFQNVTWVQVQIVLFTQESKIKNQEYISLMCPNAK